MPLTIKSIVRAILATAGLLVVLAVIAFFWLRYEYSRAEITDPMSRWRQVPVAELKQEYPEPQPCRQQYPERRAWFGATHVHTAVSYDASAFGTTTTPAMAYAFARGEPIPLRLWEDRADEDPKIGGLCGNPRAGLASIDAVKEPREEQRRDQRAGQPHSDLYLCLGAPRRQQVL